jgi:hypothetical protein
MADNFPTNAGSGGVTFASDDVGGVHFPRLKLAIGADGINDGDVSAANPMPVADASAEATLAALKLVADAISSASAAIRAAVSSLDAKTVAVNTGAIAGTVALDATAITALANAATLSTQPISGTVSTGLLQPLTDAQLRATPVPVNAAIDFTVALLRALENITDGPMVEPASGRLRVVLDATGGAQVLGTVSTVTTVAAATTLNQLAGIPVNSMVYDAIDTAWAQCIRGRIQ